MSRPIMKLSEFNWSTKDKYEELHNFKLEVSNMLQNYNLGKTEKVLVIKNWLGREGLPPIATLTGEGHKACNNEKSLLDTLNRKFKPQDNKTIKSLQFCKLIRQSNESAEEWMGRLRKAVVKCSYKEIDRQLKEQFIHGLNDEEMLVEIIRELTKCEENITIKQLVGSLQQNLGC